MSLVEFIQPKTGNGSAPPVLGYIPSREAVASLVEYENVLTFTEEEAEETGSFFGTPIFGTFEMKGFDYEDRLGGVSDLLIESCFVEVSLTKNIIKTPITNRNGTIKQSISAGDYQIKVTGGLFSPKNELKKPWSQIQHLNSFALRKKSIQVNHRLLYRLGVFDVVIDRLDLIPSEYVNVQRFSMMCSSDKEYYLELNGLR
jgi:hypothetical protein